MVQPSLCHGSSWQMRCVKQGSCAGNPLALAQQSSYVNCQLCFTYHYSRHRANRALWSWNNEEWGMF